MSQAHLPQSKKQARWHDVSRGWFVMFAVAFPAAMLMVHAGLGHEGDIAFFHEWYLAFRDGPAFYRDGPGLNYPILGVLAVCLPSHLVEHALGHALDAETFRAVFKATLAVGEGVVVFGLASLGRDIGLPAPRRVAMVLSVLPCAWAPGAWFGQIDVWGTAALLGAFVWLLRYRRDGAAPQLGAGLACLHAAILLKQLTFFTLPTLGLLVLWALGRHRKPSHWIAALGSPLVWFVADPWLVLPAGYPGHLHFVLFGGGSAHGDLIVAGGASLWSLIADINASAHEWRLLGVRAYVWGLLGFGATQLYTTGALWKKLRAAEEGNASSTLTKRSAAFVLHAGLANLAMATVLTGVHERYLVHAAPLLLLGLVAVGAGRRWIAATGFVLSWWGVFVIASLDFDAFGGVFTPLRMHQPIAILITMLFVALLARRRGDPLGGTGSDV